MGHLKDQLARYQGEIRQLYDPKASLHDPKIAELQAKVDEIEATFETHDECGDCQGWGNLDCSECHNDKECENCFGSGLTEK